MFLAGLKLVSRFVMLDLCLTGLRQVCKLEGSFEATGLLSFASGLRQACDVVQVLN